MRLRQLIFSILLTAIAGNVGAGNGLQAFGQQLVAVLPNDSVTVAEGANNSTGISAEKESIQADTVRKVTADTVKTVSPAILEKKDRYDMRVDRMKRHWNNLVPNLSTLQYAGDIGMLSLGIGWDYGKRDQWETYLMLGYVPEKNGIEKMYTLTLKEIYTPWTIRINKRFGFSPLFATFMINTTLNGEFWTSEPDRYPKGYYGFSSKVRFHIGIGQKFKIFDVQKKSHWFKDMAVYYELSTCDLYIRQRVLNSYIPWADILVLGAGIQYTIF